MNATIRIDKSRYNAIDPRIYGSFVEHLGRAVYGGIYEPTHPTADKNGFREDVLELVRALGVPAVRYPGGNFVSGYNWEDGTGAQEKRPRKMELAWRSIETNEVGIDDFQAWAKKAGAGIIMAVNLGTRGADEARNLVEYCNAETDTFYANRRRQNGYAEPFNIRTWCLGNEMDGEWQICAKTAQEYARLACETAKLMKWTDPSIELVACGSSSPRMPTYGAWERTVLRECWEHIDYLSLHCYFDNHADNSPEFLGCALDMERFIVQTAAICGEIQAEKKSQKQIYLSLDEWNVWYHSHEQDKNTPPWQVAPPLLEDVYNLEDALVVGTLLITLLRHCDTVKIACLAQLVNVIAPIMTENGGRAWAQTIFYPFMHCSNWGRGNALHTEITCGHYSAGKYGNIPYVDAVAVQNGDAVYLFAVNRSLTEPCTPDVSGIPGSPSAHTVLTGKDLKACNTADAPDTIRPEELPISGEIILPPQSWNVVKFT